MVSGSVEGRTTCPKLKNDLNTVLTCFSPISKDKKLLMPNDNTGNDFVYEDDFAQSTEEYLENSGQFDEDGMLVCITSVGHIWTEY